LELEAFKVTTVLTVKLSDLQGLTAEQIAAKMSPLVDASFGPPNGSVDPVKKRVLDYELTYGMTSEEMLKAIELGKLEETEEVAEWAIEYSLLQDLSVIPA
jgi:hypothetical protein